MIKKPDGKPVADKLALAVLGRHVNDNSGVFAGYGQSQEDGELIQVPAKLPLSLAQLLGNCPWCGSPGAG